MTPTKETTRDYSIDMIRIISMFLVLSLHCMYYGGLYHKAYELGGVNIYSIWFSFIESISSISVNLYILISGYFVVNQKFRISKLIRLVCEVVFYSWLFFLLRLFFRGTEGVTLKMLITALLPVSYIQYWFVSAYVALYVLSPVLNLFIRSINKKHHFYVIIVLVSMFSVLNSVLPLSQIMGVRRFGQSISWFVVLYMIGAFIRLYINKEILRDKAIKTFWMSIAFMNISWLMATILAENLNLNLYSEKVGTMVKYYMMFDSLPTLIASVTAFQWLRGVNITNDYVKKVVRFITPLIFGVYLIHCNYYLMKVVWIGIWNCEIPMPLLPAYALIYIVMLYIVCIMVDSVRHNICSFLTKNKSCQVLFDEFDIWTYKILDRAYNHYLNKVG